jgi:hypothetical protein
MLTRRGREGLEVPEWREESIRTVRVLSERLNVARRKN